MQTRRALQGVGQCPRETRIRYWIRRSHVHWPSKPIILQYVMNRRNPVINVDPTPPLVTIADSAAQAQAKWQ